jgi:prohibitin 1
MKKFLFFAVVAVVIASCTVVRQDEVGVKRRFGRINDAFITPGAAGYNLFTTRIIKVPTRTVNLELRPDLPSKEGLTIRTEVSILYRIKPELAPKILEKIGLNYEAEVIMPVFRSAAADVTSRYLAKDMHSGERSVIEKAIRTEMAGNLEARGFVIENVLLKGIKLPDGLAKTIEEKLQAEQDAQRMEFVKERQKRDAERLIIEAEGKKEIARIQAEGEKNAKIISAEALKRTLEIEAEGRAAATRIEANAQQKANDSLNKSLTPAILKLKQIEAFKSIGNSNNSKLVITDGKSPFLSLPDKF